MLFIPVISTLERQRIAGRLLQVQDQPDLEVNFTLDRAAE